MSPLLLDELLGAIRREPRRRAELIREHARKIGVLVSRVHRHLLAAGHGSGRKRRSDAGAAKVSAEALDMLSAALKSGVRQSGQAPLGIPMARFALEANGFDFGGASNAQLARLLRKRGLDLDTQARGTRSHQRMRSAHPNQVHQVDPSVSLLYYTPGGRQRDAGTEPGGEPYKNKPTNKKLKLWRYLLVDHDSGCFFLYYYEASGETSANLWDFICRAWEPKRGAFHGLPEHPEADRAISVREAAMLQGFPRDCRFLRPRERASFATMGRLIGNTVRCRLESTSVNRSSSTCQGASRLTASAAGSPPRGVRRAVVHSRHRGHTHHARGRSRHRRGPTPEARSVLSAAAAHRSSGLTGGVHGVGAGNVPMHGTTLARPIARHPVRRPCCNDYSRSPGRQRDPGRSGRRSPRWRGETRPRN